MSTTRYRQQIAREYLKDATLNPLVDAMLKWIRDDELWGALEEVGLLPTGKGIPCTVTEITKEALSVLRKNV